MVGNIQVRKASLPDKSEALILFAFSDTLNKDPKLTLLDKKINGLLQKKISLHEFDGKEEQILNINPVNFYEQIVMVGAGKSTEFNLNKFKNLLATALRTLQKTKTNSVNLFYFDQLGKDYFEIGKNLSLSFHLSNYEFARFKSNKKNLQHQIQTLNFYIDNQSNKQIQVGIEHGRLIAEGIYLTRDLVNEPASHQHPDSLVKIANEVAKDSKGKITVAVLNKQDCQKLGMGAFLGVAQGSEREPKFIILKYNGSSKSKKICLIGKTIIFDSGGLSLKPSSLMETMKIDMAGGATVLGVFKILSRLDIKTSVVGILPACENMPSGHAIRPGDVVTALDGQTIEVLNTDAEGRLTLADALAYTEKYLRPDVIIDLATLTGACMVALGKDLTGLFGNNKELINNFEKISQKEGDQLWPMPIYQPYLKKMKSQIADWKNTGGTGFGGAITAALFLKEFVKKTKWLHLDIAGPAYSDEIKGVIPKGGTGWGVVSLIEFIKKFS